MSQNTRAVEAKVELWNAIDGRIEEREYVCLTLTLDHDVIDGAPAARFVRRLTELIESGAGLQE